MSLKIFIIVLSILVLSDCQEVHANDDDAGFEIYKCVGAENCTDECDTKKCDCNDSIGYYYNDTTKGCDFNIKKLLMTLSEKYNTQEQLRAESVKVFRGILISVTFVIACAIAAFLTACVYCFRMNYTDRKLHQDIDALAEKLQRTGKHVPKQQQRDNKRLLPKEESCNVIVGDAGVFVV